MERGVNVTLCYRLNKSRIFAIYYTHTLMLHNDYNNNHLDNHSRRYFASCVSNN